MASLALASSAVAYAFYVFAFATFLNKLKSCCRRRRSDSKLVFDCIACLWSPNLDSQFDSKLVAEFHSRSCETKMAEQDAGSLRDDINSDSISSIPSSASKKSVISEHTARAPAAAAMAKFNGFDSMGTNGNGAKRLPMTSSPQPVYSSHVKGTDQGAGKLSSLSTQRHDFWHRNVPMNRNPNFKTWDHSDGFKRPTGNREFDGFKRPTGNREFDGFKRPTENREFQDSAELTRGPRTNTNTAAGASDSAPKKEELGLFAAGKDNFNGLDFQTEYEKARFYVIKSYSEDDIHKSIKYSVWSSTPNGNKKLDAAFSEAEAIAAGSGKNCPVFLFFSVNGSGQFVGIAEMMGHVDFAKDMDFWQVDKWTGFFPVRWHLVKDVPNLELRHIVLENNQNRPVTYTRDTQEIKLKEGIEMLKIFKNYPAKSSLIDDFEFYEVREKCLKAKKTSKPATLRIESFKNMDYDDDDDNKNQMNPWDMKRERHFSWTRKTRNSTMTSLVHGTKNLSLRGCSASNHYVAKNPRQRFYP